MNGSPAIPLTEEEDVRLRALVADRLRAARRTADLTQVEVSRKFGRQVGTWISGIETARAWVTVPDIVRLADLYGTSVDWLLWRKDHEFNGSKLGAWLTLFPGDLERAQTHLALDEALTENRQKLKETAAVR